MVISPRADERPTSVAPPELGRGGLAVVTMSAHDDGIAYVARLLYRACSDLSGVAPVVAEVNPLVRGRVSAWERLRFYSRLSTHQVLHRTDWWIFNHVGIARSLHWMPSTLRRPFAVFLNGIEAWDPHLSADRKAILRSASLRIAISDYTARRTAEIHAGLGPIHSCPLALLPDARPDGEVDHTLMAAIGPLAVVIVGRMSAAERYKGHDQLLECWPRVATEIPDAQLVVVGRGDDQERLRRKAAETGISARVLFTGYVSDATVMALLERAAVFAMPSQGEGFGLVYLKAMRAGVPCIGSTADAAGDVIVHGETGYLVDPDDGGGLAEAIASLLRDRATRARLGANGRRRFEDHFTYERFRSRLGETLVSHFGRHRARSG